MKSLQRRVARLEASHAPARTGGVVVYDSLAPGAREKAIVGARGSVLLVPAPLTEEEWTQIVPLEQARLLQETR